MSALTDGTKRFSTPKNPRESLGQQPEEETFNDNPLSGETEIVSGKGTVTQPRNTPTPQFAGITREERDRNIEDSILAGIEGGKEFGRGVWQWYRSGAGSNLFDGRYLKALDTSWKISDWYTVAFAKDIIAMGKRMTAENKSFSYAVGATTAATTEALITVIIAKPFLTLTESLGKLSWPILKNIGTKFVKAFIKKAT